MHIPIQAAIELLHLSVSGTLATHASDASGYPYPTALPFACDATHAPLILVSALAEHTRNLQADARAGQLVVDPAAAAQAASAAARMTLLGECVLCEPSALTVARYLRYQPEAEHYLALGDFSFYRLNVARVRYIGGFARMGWLDAQQWRAMPVLDETQESHAVAQLAERLAGGVDLLGVDCYGADLRVDQVRHRVALESTGAAITDPDLFRDGLNAALKYYLR